MRAALRERIDLIHDVIWDRVQRQGVVHDWLSEYVIPFLVVAYGLLVHLDKSRNQGALVATVLAAADYVNERTRW